MHNMNKVKMLEFQQQGNERGHLVIVEGKSEFVLINVAGKSKVKVKDGEGNEAIYCLNRPHTGIYLPTMVWKDMYDFSADSVLLVLASTHYDPEEYIRDYDDFVKEILKDNCGNEGNIE